jgi:hypothetical protein
MKYSPEDSSNARLKFPTVKTFVALALYRTRGSMAAYSRQISCVPSVEALSEMTSSMSR